jgi:DNA-binding NtrC family response regulator
MKKVCIARGWLRRSPTAMCPKDLDALLDQDGARSHARDKSRPPILVVDDDVTVRKSLSRLLSDDYDVAVCASAEDGVSAVHEGIHVVILDVRMKGYDGFWACEEIRKRFPAMPVIFYSAYQDLKDPFDIINRYRPFNYITKDGDVSKLLTAVATAVRLSNILRLSREVLLEDWAHRPSTG